MPAMKALQLSNCCPNIADAARSYNIISSFSRDDSRFFLKSMAVTRRVGTR
jgi:hypothetical protein